MIPRWIISLVQKKIPDIGDIIENFKHESLDWGIYSN